MFRKLKEAFKSFTNTILSLFKEEEKKESVETRETQTTQQIQQQVTVEEKTTQELEIQKPIEKVEVEIEEKKEEEKKSIFSRIAQKVGEAISYTKLSEDKIAKLCENLFIQLVECDVAVEVSEAITEAVKKQLAELKIPRFSSDKERIIRENIRKAILEVIKDIPDVDFLETVRKIYEERNPVVILFLGPNGYGKTTTIAKIGYLLKKNGYSVVFAAADTFRAGAIEQLEEHGRRLGIKVVKHRYGADPAAVIHDAIAHAESKGIDFVLVDTAGRMHTDVNLMDELKKIYRVAEPDLSIFVADALLGNEALEVAKTYSKYVNIDGLIITKVDAYPKGGSILTFLVTLRKPIYFLGVGQRYEDLIPFRKEWFIEQILGE